MGSLRTLTVLLTLGAWGAAAEGGPPDGGYTPAQNTVRSDPPAHPSKYIEAGIYLLEKKGDSALAAQYFQAANDYRDMLSPQEQSRLDQYRARLAPATPPVLDSAVGVAGAPPMMASPRSQAAPGDKQAGRWLLQQARDMAAQGRFDEADQKVAEARAMNVKWGLFDDTPDRVAADISKVRPAADAATAAMKPKEAKARLKDARAALAAGRVNEAEQIAGEIRAQGLRFGILEDNPDKVLAAVEAVRRRDTARQTGSDAALRDLYAASVEQAREHLAAGRLDDAETTARKAQAMNVVPPLTADRAEAVLHDVALMRTSGAMPVAAATAVEDEANQLLAGGDRQAAAQKYLEAERMRAQRPTADPAVQTVQAEAVDMPPQGLEPQPIELSSTPAPDLTVPMLELDRGSSSPVNPGEAMMIQARALMANGNYPAASQLAERARAGGYGVEAQADDLLAQINLTSQASGLKLYEAALDALRKGDNDRARALLNEVAATETQDEALVQRVQDLLTRIPTERSGKATIEAVDDAEAVKAQKLNVEVGTKVAESRRLMETDPDKAVTLLEETLASVKGADVNPAAGRTLVRRVEVAIELAKKEKVTFDEKMKDKAYRAEIENKRLRILEADKAKKEQLDVLLKAATEAEAQGDYALAEQKARMAAEIDPNNVAAVALSTKARWQRRYERDVKIRNDMDESAVEAFQSVTEAGIVPTDVQQRSIAYPKSFADLTRTRREMNDRLAPRKDPKEVETEAKLQSAVTLDMQGDQPLSDVIQFLASYHGLNLVLDPKALGEEGLTPNTPVTAIKAKDIPLKTALKLILSPLRLTYRIDGNVVLVTSPTASRSQTYPIAYPVGDLIISPHGKGRAPMATPGINGFSMTDPTQPQADGANMQQAALTGQTQFGASMDKGDGTPSAVAGQRNLGPDDFEPLVQLIKASVAPGTWQDASSEYAMAGLGLGGGGDGGLGADQEQAIGSITPFFLNISLIIRHTSEVHDEIVDLLRQLRRLQDLQISVEVRFITVSDSFFEEIGVDFDFNIQSDSVGPKSSFAIPNPDATFYDPVGGGTGGGTAATAPYLINPARDHAIGRGQEPLTVGTNGPTNNFLQPPFTPGLGIPFIQDSISAISPFNAVPNVGATFGLAFLSDLEVYFFMRALQGDQRSNLVQAPKVTTFNGAPASVFSTRQVNYVAALTPVVGAGAVAFQPTIAGFQDGVQLFVTPVVSADRRYVRMTLSPVFQTLEGFDTFTIPAAVGGGGLGGGATSINGQVQLPRFVLNQVSTTVTVPDGGTVLLGGVKRLREERREFGVPILSKTPWINRLFRNVGVGRTTDSLMIMVTPRIIILEEEEEKLGIPAVNDATF